MYIISLIRIGPYFRYFSPTVIGNDLLSRADPKKAPKKYKRSFLEILPLGLPPIMGKIKNSLLNPSYLLKLVQIKYARCLG